MTKQMGGQELQNNRKQMEQLEEESGLLLDRIHNLIDSRKLSQEQLEQLAQTVQDGMNEAFNIGASVS